MEWAFRQSDTLDNWSNRQWGVQPPLISYATWNIWWGPADHSHGFPHGYQESLLQPAQQTASLGSNILDSKFTLQPLTPQLPTPLSTLSVLVAIMVYLLLTQQSSSHGNVTTPITEIPIRLRYGNYQWSLFWVQSMKSQKSCSHWITIIIQQLWDTTWDLTTHWNVEIIAI